MKNKFEIFLDTDIIKQHQKKNIGIKDTLLTKCLSLFDCCYTSVINASEIFSECPDLKNMEKTKDLFKDISILGIPFRYSLKIGEVMNIIKKKTWETHLGTLQL